MPLLHQLRHEWPRVAIDMVIDRQFAEVAELLTAIRHVIAREFSDLRSMSAMTATLPPSLGEWARPLAATGYGRLINLTFTPQSGRLAAYLRVTDTRGVIAIKGIPVPRNLWFKYCVDMHRSRGLNRFHVADLLALGGSGPVLGCRFASRSPCGRRIAEKERGHFTLSSS